jgi:aminocarboxymuconate-semialdehyde decarboxylase
MSTFSVTPLIRRLVIRWGAVDQPSDRKVHPVAAPTMGGLAMFVGFLVAMGVSRFLPFFKAAEAMGAVLFFHPQPQHNFLMQRTPRDGLFNSLGVILDDAIVVAILIAGGVLEACPKLRACIAHGGGPACYAMGRLDRGWQGRPEARRIPQPPSAYQRRLYYDTVVGSEKALRFLLDEVGADRVVLGSDWPFVPWHPSPVTWVQGLASLTPAEKEQILWRNLEGLLGL